jgi:multidrug efflux system outer membrane protein
MEDRWCAVHRNAAAVETTDSDFWGHNSALLRAADFTALGKRFDRDVVALTQLASVANTYFLVLEGQDRLTEQSVT